MPLMGVRGGRTWSQTAPGLAHRLTWQASRLALGLQSRCLRPQGWPVSASEWPRLGQQGLGRPYASAVQHHYCTTALLCIPAFLRSASTFQTFHPPPAPGQAWLHGFRAAKVDVNLNELAMYQRAVCATACLRLLRLLRIVAPYWVLSTTSKSSKSPYFPFHTIDKPPHPKGRPSRQQARQGPSIIPG